MNNNRRRQDNFSPKGLSAITAGAKRFFYDPMESFIIVLVIVLALFLAISSNIVWKNMDRLYDNWSESAEVAVYLKKGVGAEKVDSLVKEIRENKLVSDVKLIEPDDGMKVFMKATSLATLLSSFKENPLPSVVIVYPKIKLLSKRKAQDFLQTLKSNVDVDVVKADIDWIERSYSWLGVLSKLSLFLFFVLSVNALLVLCGVSFAMSRVLSEKEHASKIVLQYQFAWYGLVGSLLALLLAKIIVLILQDNGMFLEGLKSGFIVFFVFISVILSVVSSRLSTAKT